MSRLFLLFALFSLSSYAAEFTVETFGRSYVSSCGYYSNESGDYNVKFRGWSLPWGTRVFVTYGFKGYNALGGGSDAGQQWFEWAYKNEVEANPTEAYVWQANFHQTLHSRSSNQYLTGLQYAIRLEVPGQSPRYFPPMAWSFYEANIGNNGNSPCVGSGVELPAMQLIPHRIIERN